MVAAGAIGKWNRQGANEGSEWGRGRKIAVPIGARYHPNDPFGYSVYRVVAFMPPDQVARVEALRWQSGMKRSLIPAHVEVESGSCDVDGLDTVRARTRRIARKTAPMHLEFADGGKLVFFESSAVIRIRPTKAGGSTGEGPE